MSSGRQLIEAYEVLLQQLKGMLELARHGDWTALLQEKPCAPIDAERLQQLEARVSLDRQERLRKAGLLEQILVLDAELRTHLLTRRDELDRLILSARRQRALNRTYRPAMAAMMVYQAAECFDKDLP